MFQVHPVYRRVSYGVRHAGASHRGQRVVHRFEVDVDFYLRIIGEYRRQSLRNVFARHNVNIPFRDKRSCLFRRENDIFVVRQHNDRFGIYSVYRLRDALTAVYPHYDYILLDCPPAMGPLTINALTTANNVIIPLQPEFFALEGIIHLVNNIRGIQEKWNPNLEILGVLLTMYDRRYGQTREVENQVRSTFGDTVFKTVIPRNVRVSEAPSHGIPALYYDFDSAGAQAYLRVATEVVNKLQQSQEE